MSMKTYTVAQVARRTGISVRTLHHYEALGLLTPARRSDKGYRLYGTTELQRLQHILALKALGFSLAEIGACLAADMPSFHATLRQQIVRLRETVLRQNQLLARLEALSSDVESGRMIDAETLLSTIEASTMIERYFTEEQRTALRQNGAKVSRERLQMMKAEWPVLVEHFRQAREQKMDPASEEVQALGARWRALVKDFDPGKDPSLRETLKRVWDNESSALATRMGIDLDVFEYARRALKVSEQ
jgi:MerR family transcriptional regulator, thiopeptide resistance regulator